MNNFTVGLIVEFTTIPSNSLLNEIHQLLRVVNCVVLCGVISLFGVLTNIANICVFLRQGFKDSINISLMGLAVSDLVCSVAMLWYSIGFNPLLLVLDLSVNLQDFTYFTGGWTYVCFNRITSVITAFITLERCLCIAMPLKVKNIVTPFRTKVIIVLIFPSVILLFIPFFFVNKFEWMYNVPQNRSVYSLTFADNRETVDSITFFIHSVALSLILIISVAICTIILVIKLNKKTKWREATVAQTNSKPGTASIRDKKVGKMITLISAIFIFCYVPPTINFLFMACNSDFNIKGRLENMFFISWSVAFVLETVNSSVNIFVYFKMSSKFKVTFHEIFCDFYRSKLMI